MKRFFLFIILCLPALIIAKPLVVVSVAPQKYVVERIGRINVTVDLLVPPGASPHFYEPTMRQVLKASAGKVWFRLGEGFEIQVLKVLGDRMVVVNQSKGGDPHIWLSPTLLREQAHQITETLSKLFPEHQSEFEANCSKLIEELDALDREIVSEMKRCEKKSILVSHGAFGYFCRDYGLNQMTIEAEGKEPTPRYISLLLTKARAEKIDCVFIQPQYNMKGAKRIANALGADVKIIDPYKEDVIENLRTFAQAICRR